MGLPHDAYLIDISKNYQTSPEFPNVTPTTKISAIIAPLRPECRPLAQFESGANLICFAETPEPFLPANRRHDVLRWLVVDMGGVGRILGQVGAIRVFAGEENEDPCPKDRYRAAVERLPKVLGDAVTGKDRIVGEWSIADIAICPWLRR